MIRAACVAAFLCSGWHAWGMYEMGRSHVAPSLLVGLAVYPLALIGLVGGLVLAAREKSLAMLALSGLAVGAAIAPRLTGGALLRRGTLDRVHAHVTTAELRAFAAPWCAAALDGAKQKELPDRARWPAWLTAIDPGGVHVRPICGGYTPTCFALHVEFGGGLIGRWGVAAMPGTYPDKPYLEELEPGLYWTDGP